MNTTTCPFCGDTIGVSGAYHVCPDMPKPADVERLSPQQMREALPKDAPSVFKPYVPLARDMTKRERFAMAAMQAMVTNTDWTPDAVATFSVECADALLAALEAK